MSWLVHSRVTIMIKELDSWERHPMGIALSREKVQHRSYPDTRPFSPGETELGGFEPCPVSLSPGGLHEHQMLFLLSYMWYKMAFLSISILFVPVFMCIPFYKNLEYFYHHCNFDLHANIYNCICYYCS